MNVIVMAASLLGVIGYYLWLVQPAARTVRDQPAAESMAAAVLVVQKAAVAWCLADASCAPAGGLVPADQLVLPPGYRPSAVPVIVATADGHRVSTYLRVFPQDPGGLRVEGHALARSLGDLTGGGPAAGLAHLGGVASRTGQPPVRLTPQVPEGAPVVSQKVR